MSEEMQSSVSYSKVVLIKRFKKKTPSHLIFLELALILLGAVAPVMCTPVEEMA